MYLVYQKDAVAEYWIPGAFSNETASRVLEGTKKVVNDSNGTGYAAHRDDILLAGKTGTAEIKASKDDTSGTELGWFAIFTAEDTVEQPLDETYRELSRKYLNPISFERNNMFIVDWSEEDFGDLNFYDMYDILYDGNSIQTLERVYKYYYFIIRERTIV